MSSLVSPRLVLLDESCFDSLPHPRGFVVPPPFFLIKGTIVCTSVYMVVFCLAVMVLFKDEIPMVSCDESAI